GFALGIERVILLKDEIQAQAAQAPDLVWILDDPAHFLLAMQWINILRGAYPSLSQINPCQVSSMKSQFKRADKLGARWACVMGSREAEAGLVTFKFLREDKVQETLSAEHLIQRINQLINKEL
ncbi:MAG: His/Gly/Thr/Pro-type tRNA ligase C-terminal domain-containing protein, partial [Gammaproteobacteria bacterium]